MQPKLFSQLGLRQVQFLTDCRDIEHAAHICAYEYARQ
jgi:hypothetical protein